MLVAGGLEDLEVDLAHDLERLKLHALRRRSEREGGRGRSKGDRERTAVEALRTVPAIAALDARGQEVREGIFDAATDRRTPDRPALGCDCRREGDAASRRGDEVGADRQVGDGRAAGGVDQETIPGVAEAATHRTLPVAAPVETVAGYEQGRKRTNQSVGPRPALPVEVAFDAEHPVAARRLPVTANLSTPD